MKVSKEELLHIANLARLSLEDSEIEKYQESLEDILNFADVVNKAPVENLKITVASNEKKNVFRKDVEEIFEDNEALFINAIDPEQNMFKIPKVLN